MRQNGQGIVSDVEIIGSVEAPHIQPKGLCEICGNPTGDKRSKRCDDHPRTKASKKPVASRIVTSEKVTDTSAARTIAKLLIVITLVLMYARIRRIGIPDPTGNLADELSLTEDEALEIAKPIARFANSTPMGSRLIGPVVRNEDLIGALFAIYEYNRRTEQLLESIQKGGAIPANQPPAPRRNVVPISEVPQTGPDDSGEVDFFPTGGFAHDYESG